MKQRLGLARALLSKRKLLISVEIFQSLQANANSKNVIFIAREKGKCSQLLSAIPYAYSNNLDKEKFKLEVQF